MLPDISVFFEVKEVAEDGTFSGIASVYDVEDLGGDIIEKGAFTKTLAENPIVPILWQHDQSEVIGQGELVESGKKINISGRLDMEDPLAKKAYRKMKAKLIKGLSIGFQAIKSTWQDIEENGVMRSIRRISEVKLWEVSVVTFPMLPQAQVQRIKSADEDVMARVRELDKKLQALEAARGTPVTEPPKAVEPPSQPAEPVVNHSLAKSISQILRGE